MKTIPLTQDAIRAVVRIREALAGLETAESGAAPTPAVGLDEILGTLKALERAHSMDAVPESAEWGPRLGRWARPDLLHSHARPLP